MKFGRSHELMSKAIRKLAFAATNSVDAIAGATHEIGMIATPMPDDEAQEILKRIRSRLRGAPNPNMGNDWQAVSDMPLNERSELVEEILALFNRVDGLHHKE